MQTGVEARTLTITMNRIGPVWMEGVGALTSRTTSLIYSRFVGPLSTCTE
jgi:hypothetical protein